MKKGRIEVITSRKCQEVSIRLLRNYYVIVPLVICALVWLFGLVFLSERVFRTYTTIVELGIAGMLFFWLMLGGAILSTLYWIFTGKEKVIVTSEYLQIEKPIHLYKRRRAYLLDEVTNLGIGREAFNVRRNGEWMDDFRLVIKFEIPKKTVTFGRGLKQEEADFVILHLAKSEYLDEQHFKPIFKA